MDSCTILGVKMGTPVKPKRGYSTTLRREQAQVTHRRILDASRRLFIARGYAYVTMRDVAAEAGVAVQTVHAVFGTKLGLAQGIVELAFEDVDPDVLTLIRQADFAQDPSVTLRTVATSARRIQEHFAAILLFMQQTGDPQLLDIAERFDTVRVESLAPVVSALARAGVLSSGVSAKEAADLIWALTSPEWYGLLVRRREWDVDRWEENLGDTLVRLLLA
jgi:AcrR family transcriptional regulator